MSNPFAQRAKEFGVQARHAGSHSVSLAFGDDIDLPPPPPGFTETVVTPAKAAPALAPIAETSKPTPAKTAGTAAAPAAEIAVISPNFKPPPGSSGPPPAGGSKAAATKPAAAAPAASAAPAAKQPAVSPALKQAVAAVNAAAPKPAAAAATPAPASAAKPASAAGPVPSSTNVKSTLTAGANVVNGANRGAFADLYKSAAPPRQMSITMRPAGLNSNGTTNSSNNNASVVNKLKSLNMSGGGDDLPPPPPPDDDLPPPPAPAPHVVATPFGQAGLRKTGIDVAAQPKPYASPASPTPKTKPAAHAAPVSAPPAAASSAGFTSPSVAAAAAAAANANCSRCSTCGLAIRGALLELGDGRTLHPECLVCARCQNPISGGLVSIGEVVLHETCLCCNACGKNLASLPFATHPTTGAFFCQEHARQAQPNNSNNNVSADSGSRCSGCQQPVDPSAPSEPLVAASGTQIYHARCLRCHTCQTQINAAGKVYQQDGHFYCEKDYLSTFGRRCSGCKQTITDGSIMSVDTGNGGTALSFHPACMKCAQCATPLQGKSFFLNPRGEGIVCDKCS